jgi:hypothetical protein
LYLRAEGCPLWPGATQCIPFAGEPDSGFEGEKPPPSRRRMNSTKPKQYQALATISYIANMMFIKLSIAIFLLRIAVKKVYIYILQVSIVVVAIWSVIIFFYDIFQCVPVEAQWNFTITSAKCVSGTQFVAAAYSISVMSISTDWLYALLPIPMIWSVQMTKQAKATVAFILSLGILCVNPFPLSMTTYI